MRRRGCFPLLQTHSPFSVSSLHQSHPRIISRGIWQVSDAIRGWVEFRAQEKKSERKTYEENIVARLAEPFVPVLSPQWGPIFPREQWSKDFRQLCDSQMYHLYYGPSQVGKSLAVVNALKDRPGVGYVRLRATAGGSGEVLPRRVAEGIGYFGEKQVSDVALDIILTALEEAAKNLKQSKNIKPVLVLEDIDTCVDRERNALHYKAELLAASLVDMHNAGLLNVVYTASDFSSLDILSRVSGHSRLECVPFPKIPDEEFAKQLTQFVVEDSPKENESPFKLVQRVPEHAEKGKWVISTLQEASYIVERLDSHMGDATKCLREIVMNSASVQDAVSQVISRYVPRVAAALYGDSAGKVDTSVFVASAAVLLEKLASSTKSSVDWDTVLLGELPNLDEDSRNAAVQQLVASNLLSYIDRSTVTLHTPAIKWAFLRIRENSSLQMRMILAKRKFGGK